MSDDPRVFHGPPPESVLWDAYPLAPDSWGNIRGFADGSGDGPLLRMRRWIRCAPMTSAPLPIFRPAHAPLPPFVGDGGERLCYVPTEADRAMVGTLFPEALPNNPPWSLIGMRLRVAGHMPDELAATRAPDLLALLAVDRDQGGAGRAETPRGKRGRKPGADIDPAKDKRLCADWRAAKRQGTTRDAFARERGIAVHDLIAAQDREKYRRTRAAE